MRARASSWRSRAARRGGRRAGGAGRAAAAPPGTAGAAPPPEGRDGTREWEQGRTHVETKNAVC